MPLSERLHVLPNRVPDNGAGYGLRITANFRDAFEKLQGQCEFEKFNPDLKAIPSFLVRKLVADLDEHTKTWNWPMRQQVISRPERKRVYAEWFGLNTPNQFSAISQGVKAHGLIDFASAFVTENYKEILMTPDNFRVLRVVAHVIGPRASYDDVDWEAVRKDIKALFGNHRIAGTIPSEIKKKRRYRSRIGTAVKTVHPSGNIGNDTFSANENRASDDEETDDRVTVTRFTSEEIQRRRKNRDRFVITKAISVHRDLEPEQGQILQRYDRDALREIADRLDDCTLIQVEADEALADIAQILYITMYVRWAMGSGPSETASKDAEDAVNSFEMKKQLQAIEEFMRKNPLVRTLRHFHEELRKWAIDNPELSAHITPRS